MKKSVYSFCLGVSIIFVSACAHHPKEQMVVKSLDETIVFPKIEQQSLRALLNKDIKYIMNYFKSSRDLKINDLAVTFNIHDPMFIIEWGGGLGKDYVAVIVTKDHLYWWKRMRELNSFGDILVNPEMSLLFKDATSKLKDYDGGSYPKGMVDDGDILFMTFYKNNIPRKTFSCNYPYYFEPIKDDIFYDPLQDELKILVDTIMAMPELK